MKSPEAKSDSGMQSVPYRIVLTLLLVIFVFRVIAQFIQSITPTAWIPEFDVWSSGLMPYPILLALQGGIIVLMIAAISMIPTSKARPLSGALLALTGWFYVAIMMGRLVVGAMNLSDHSWFDGALSTAFHFVIASFILVVAHAISGRTDKPVWINWSKYLAYPLLLVGSYTLFIWLRDTGSSLLFASYLSVLIGGFGILLHETFNPARRSWRPSREDVVSDGMFLIVVQIGVPAALRFTVLALIISIAGNDTNSILDIWPNDWPILAQIALMMVIAEFFRYWLHRMLHEFNPLWHIHAVHHASDKLYTVNVGRFHPLDKGLQFLGDSLPFLLLGVGADVFAAYFVLYAVNGFYQHSNADVRLGPLNWIIAGPELHRWHHSTVISEGHANYGNNLIIWDTIFGTRFFPKDRTVSEVGIGNKRWPRGFLHQLIAPLTEPTEHERK